ncbi:protein EMBRYONIC FLOWER 1 [Typha angustifolia]|uniref:protein EMBRYONIC FLOWER 1 n=1 Tax=Typha angustifolia TaxID=59011 RepID=UPI003C2B0E3C
MEISLVEESNNGRECMLVSQSSPSASVVRPIDPTADDDQGAKPCDHFSIRGYVAQVRKNDRKNCSPFLVFHDQQSDEDCNLLPPLPVTKFRRWDCKNCLHKASVSVETIADGAFCRIHSAKLNYCSVMPFHADGNRSLGCFQQLSEVKTVVGRSVDGDVSINEGNSRCCRSVYSGNKEITYAVTCPSTKGLQVLGASHDSYNEIQNHSSEKPSEISGFVTEAETCQMWREGQKKEDPALNYPGTSLHEKILNPNSEEAEENHEVLDAAPTSMNNNLITVSGQRDAQFLDDNRTKEQTKTAERETKRLLGREIGIPKDDPPTILAAHVIDTVSKRLHEQEFSTENAGFPECMVQGQMEIDQEDISDGKFHPRKARKVRLLTDIIGAEEFGISGKGSTFGHDTVSGQSENNFNRRQHASKRKGQHLMPGVWHSGEVKVKPIKHKKKCRSLESEDDDSSLMCWLNRASKRVRTCKEDAERKHTDTVIVKSISTLDKCARKDTNLTPKQYRAKECKKKPSVHSLQYAMPRSYLMSQSDVLSSREGNIDTGRSLINLQNFQNNVSRKNMSKKNKKGHQTGTEESSRIYLSKVSLGNRELKNVTGFHGERIFRKKKVKWKYEKEALDDIPMDIVELLAKNQHERHLTNEAAFDTKHTPSEMTEFMKDNYLLNDTEGCGRKELSEMLIHYSQQKSPWSNREINFPTTSGHFGERLNPDHSHTVGKQDTNMSKEDLFSATGYQNVLQHKDQPSKEVHRPTIDPKKKCIPQYHTWSKLEMPNSQSCHIDQELLGQRPFKNVDGDSPVLPGSIPFGSNILKVGMDCSHVKSLEGNSLIQQPGMDAVDTGRMKSVNQLKISTADAEISTQRTLPPVSSVVEGGNICHSKLLRPSDLYTNDTIPAMHLLRLMDSSKWSGLSHYEAPYENQIGLLQKPNLHSANQGRGFLNTECRAETSTTMKHTFPVECHDLDHNQQSSSKPLRPLPRIGILGSLLQKEITNRSDDCGTQSGYRIGQSERQISFHINRKNSECSSSATYPAILTSQKTILKHGNSEQHFALANYVADAGYCPQRDNISYIGICNNEKAVHPLKSCITMDICVVNRNPADFTIIDKDNEFMIGKHKTRARSKLSSGNLQ